MSHVIHAWETPAVDDLDAAGQVLQTQAKRPAAPNPKFAILMATVQQALHPQPEDEDSPWVGGPPDGHCSTVVYGVQVEPAQAARAFGLMAKAAGPLGLTVFDDQLGWLALPDGRRLGVPPPSPPAPAGPAPLKSKAKVFGLLHARLHELLGPLGWAGRRQDAAFAWDGPEVRCEIGFGCVARPPVFELALSGCLLPQLPPPWQSLASSWGNRCFVRLDDLLAAAGFQLPGPVVQAHVRYTRLTDEAALNDWARACTRAVGHVLLPFLQDGLTLAGLEAKVNPPPGQPCYFVPSYIDVILAHAMGNPRADAVLAAAIEARREPWTRDKFRQLGEQIDRLHAGPG